MAQLFDITKVTVGPRNLEAEVVVSPDAPLTTSEDPQGTELVLQIMPGLADHLCLGDASSNFGEVVADTEVAHLLEHVTVELLAQTNAAGDVTGGQTVEVGERTYRITLACPDDVLVAGALSSAVWILQWAYSGGGEPEPDVEAIASGLVDLVESLGSPDAPSDGGQGADADAPLEGTPAGEASAEVPGETGYAAYGDYPDYPEYPAEEPFDEGETQVWDRLSYAPDDGYGADPAGADGQLGDVPADGPQANGAPGTAAAEAEPALTEEPVAAPEAGGPAEEPQPEPEDDDPWGMRDIPRPHLVR